MRFRIASLAFRVTKSAAYEARFLPLSEPIDLLKGSGQLIPNGTETLQIHRSPRHQPRNFLHLTSRVSARPVMPLARMFCRHT